MADQDKTTKGRTRQTGGTAAQGSGDIASEPPGSISLADAEPSTGTAGRTGATPTTPIESARSAGTTAGPATPAPGATGTASTRGTTATGGTGAATATARSLVDQAKETAGHAYEAVTEKAAATLDERKTTVSTGLSAVADSLRNAADNLSGRQADNQLATFAGRYTDTASRKLNDIANYFERKDVRAMVHDAEDFARRNPAIFIGAAFGLGLLAARFLKSTPPNKTAAGRGRTFESSAARAGSFGDTGTDRPIGTTMPNPM